MSQRVTQSDRPPRRLGRTLFIVTLAILTIVGWRGWNALESQHATLQRIADERAGDALVRELREDLQAVVPLRDPALIESTVQRFVDGAPGVDGVSVQLWSDPPKTVGRVATADDVQTRGDLRARSLSPTAILLGAEHVTSGDTRGEIVGQIIVYGPHPAGPLGESATAGRIVEGEWPWIAAIVALILSTSLVIQRRLGRLADAVVNVTDSTSEVSLYISGADEISWISSHLEGLRAVLAEQVDRVHDRNASLQRNLQSKEEILAKQAKISSALVSPLETRSGLQASAGAIAMACEAELVLIFRAGVASGAFECVAAHGLPEHMVPSDMESDPGILEHLCATEPGCTTLSALKPSHRWMRGMNRNIPLFAVAGTSLVYRDRVQGALIIARREAFVEPTPELVFNAAKLLSIAVANIAAYDEIHAFARVLQEKNAQLVSQRDQLEEANRLKTQFTATISHELRTPINAIVGYGELLIDEVYGPVASTQRDALSGILQSANHLLSLVNQVLDLSCAESGGLTVYPRSTNVEQIIHESLLVASPLCRNRPYRLASAVVPVALETDPERVHQILVNLLTNAIKFTKEGGVYLSVDDSNPSSVRISVQDTGPGIASEHQALIFQAFRQIEQDYDRAHDGVGLGLAISQRLAHALGGRLTLTSAPGHGSTFTLELPRKFPSSTPAHNDATPAPNNKLAS